MLAWWLGFAHKIWPAHPAARGFPAGPGDLYRPSIHLAEAGRTLMSKRGINNLNPASMSQLALLRTETETENCPCPSVPSFNSATRSCGKRPSAVEDPTAPEIHDLVRDLADTLAHWRSTTGYGRGIAAPQLGELQRVIFLKLPDAEPWPLINPEIIERSAEKIIVWDACLSFLSIFMQVERHRQVTVRYQNLNGETHEFERRRRPQPFRTPAARNRSPRRHPRHRPGRRHKDHLHPRRIRKALPRREPVRGRSGYNQALNWSTGN